MPAGGAPFNNEDIYELFQKESWDVIQGLLSKYDADTYGVLISGCVGSANASNFDMTAGIVYLNGEFMRVDAVTNKSFPQYIQPKTPVTGTRVFGDSGTKAFTEEKKAELLSTTPVSGQYIPISGLVGGDLPPYRRLRLLEGLAFLKRTSAGAESLSSTTRLYRKVIEIGDWNMDSTANLAVTHNITTWKGIRNISIVIRDDNDTTYYSSNGDGNNEIGVSSFTSTVVNLARKNTGTYDNTSFDSTSYNRGWLLIDFEI